MSIYQITFKANIDNSSQVRNVHHYEFPNYVPTQAQVQEAVDYLDSQYKTYFQSRFTTTTNVYAYDARRVDSPNEPTIEYVPTASPWNGTATSGLLPMQVAGLVRWKAQTQFPRNARSYIAGFSNAANTTDGVINSTTVDAMESWGDAVQQLAITAGDDANKVAVTYGGTPRVVTAANAVTTTIANNGRNRFKYFI